VTTSRGWGGQIAAYRDRLPVQGFDSVVTLCEGNTPLVRADRLAAAIAPGIEVWLKCEGQNPTGSFKDRGMTVAVTRALADGAEAVICASTGNTSASAAAFAARAGIRAYVVVPQGKIALGKLSQAVMHGARVVQIEGNFDDALTLVREAERAGGRVVLFEQPMGTRDLDAMREITARATVPIAADESAATLDDVLAIAHARAAHVVNLKVMKSGVVQALDMALAARAHGLGLMIGGMVESDIAMSLSAHLAAGLGGVEFVDLDTAWLLAGDPYEGGYRAEGPRYELDDAPGLGVRARGSSGQAA
jgi:hypothetical protein